MNNMSPCINECKLDKKEKYCISCLRTINEISSWRNFSDIEKKKIISKIKNKKIKL